MTKPKGETGLGREVWLVRACLAALGLHVLDDSFLQPQPGTSAGDHLAGGMVPVALLAAAAVAYPLLRPGLRGALAATLGLLGFVTGIEAAYYGVKVGPSGDDFTGFLALAAGLGLLATGAATLWRTRRLDERPRRRYLRRGLIAVAVLVIAFELVFPIGLAYVVTHTAHAEVPPADLGARPEEVSFRTSDGLELRGWYIPSRNRAAVIAFPGRSGPQPQARLLARHGYGVLLFDRRGEGESEGDPNAFGWASNRDLKAALAFLARRSDVDPRRIGGIGLSVGGEMLLQTAAESNALEAVVSEGAGFRSTREHVHLRGAGKWLLLPQSVTLTAATAVFANDTPPPYLGDLVGRISPRPVFLIYAGHGQGGEELNPQYYAAAGRPKTIWKIPEATHTGGLEARPAEYERRVVGIFDRALLDARG